METKKSFLEIFGYDSDGTKKQIAAKWIAVSARPKMNYYIWDTFVGNMEDIHSFKRNVTTKEMQWLYENQPLDANDIEFLERWRR